MPDTMTKRPPTNALPPLPPEFAEVFIRRGWRGVERAYGCRTDRLVKFHHLAGGEALTEARKRFMATGVCEVPVVERVA